MNAREAWSRRLASINLSLTTLAMLVVVGGYVLHVRGGLFNRFTDRLQFGVVWGYLLLTPLLAAAVLLLRDKSTRATWLRHLPLALWLCVLVTATFVHF